MNSMSIHFILISGSRLLKLSSFLEWRPSLTRLVCGKYVACLLFLYLSLTLIYLVFLNKHRVSKVIHNIFEHLVIPCVSSAFFQCFLFYFESPLFAFSNCMTFPPASLHCNYLYEMHLCPYPLFPLCN